MAARRMPPKPPARRSKRTTPAAAEAAAQRARVGLGRRGLARANDLQVYGDRRNGPQTVDRRGTPPPDAAPPHPPAKAAQRRFGPDPGRTREPGSSDTIRRFGRTGDPVPIPKRTADLAKREGLRVWEDGSYSEKPQASRAATGARRPATKRPAATVAKASARPRALFTPTAKLDPSQVVDVRPDTRSERAGIRRANPGKPPARPSPRGYRAS